jgi:AcrR family transcriptional regulator
MSVPKAGTETGGNGGRTRGRTAGKPVRQARAERRGARRRLDPEQRREEVLTVAAVVFAEKGYRAANVTDIVERAGIGRGTFYLYFDSKQDVFLELIELYFAEFEELLTENQKKLAAAIESGEFALPVWRENMIGILEYHRDNPELTSLIYSDALGSDEHFSARVDELSGVARKQMRKDFELLQKSGMMRAGDLDVITNIILGSSIYVIMENVVKKKRPNLDAIADELIEYHVRALMRDELTGLIKGEEQWRTLKIE